MDFCIGTCAKIDQIDLVKQAEDVGASHFEVDEGPLLFSDPYQYLAPAARETSSIKLGTRVTNPLTRIPAVTANSIATVNSLAPRAGVPGDRHREQRAAVDGSPSGEAVGAGQRVGDRPRPARRTARDPAVAKPGAGDRVPRPRRALCNFADSVDIWMSAGGPKGLAIAARHADYMTYCLGPNPDMIGVVRRELDKAVAEAAGHQAR